MTDPVEIDFELNGERAHREVPPGTVLLDMLRHDFGLKGVRGSCERGVCGACTVLLDDVPVASCSVFAFDVDGTRVDTVEGQRDGEEPGPVQQAFAECGGFQCGYCTPGMVMLTTGLLRSNPKPDPEQAREWIGSNICRCTGYQMIMDSVQRAAELTAERAGRDEAGPGAEAAGAGDGPDDGAAGAADGSDAGAAGTQERSDDGATEDRA
jgi:aerobic carbon-monoxide dehydrogenase small subunit